MIILSVSPRRRARREVARSPLGGYVIHGPDDLSSLSAKVGMYEVLITRADYEVLKAWFEKYEVQL